MIYYLTNDKYTIIMKTIEKHKITYMHFILSVLIILVHAINNKTTFEKFFSIETGIGQFAVPLFFIISGFLFFYNSNSFNDINNKIIKRIYTLLIPYLLWNLIYYIFHLILEAETTFDIFTLIDAVINHSFNPVFWYIYQLILLTIISPIIYYISKIKKMEIPFMVLLSLLIIGNTDIPFINEDAIIYYLFGCYLSRLYNNKKFKIIDNLYIFIFSLISILVFILNRYLHNNIFNNIELLHYYTLSVIYLRIAIAMFMFYFCDIFFNYKHIPKYMNNSFFLYSIHYMIVRFIITITNNYLINFFDNKSFTLIQILLFLLSPMICITISYYLSLFLTNKLPKFYSILTGNRK